MLLTLVSAGISARHRCVLADTTPNSEHGHASHEEPDEPRSDQSCDMYVSCTISVIAPVTPIESAVSFSAHNQASEPALHYFSPSLPTETPPPRV